MLSWLLVPTLGCGLIGVEPDEIDVLDGDTGGLTASGGEETGSNESATDTNGESSATGDGDGDPGTGDGDGDPDSTGTGDGDGDPATSSGDGDGDATGDGDGDGDPSVCEELPVTDAMDGDNAIDIPDVMGQLMTDACGAAGPEQLFVYTATATTIIDFDFVTDEPANLYILGLDCNLAEPLACASEQSPVSPMLNEGDTVYVVVDSLGGPVTGTLTITAN